MFEGYFKVMNSNSSDSLFTSAPRKLGDTSAIKSQVNFSAAECLCMVVSNEWVNEEYKHMVLDAPTQALTAKAGQFFQLLCDSPDDGMLWARRPMSVYKIDAIQGRVEFLYKCIGKGTKGMAMLTGGDEFNIFGPLGKGFWLEPEWKNIVVVGRGVGLATLAPISKLAAKHDVGVTVILSAHSSELIMSVDLFETMGADIIPVLDEDGSSKVENVEQNIACLIMDGKADAFFTCGSSRLLSLIQKWGKKHNIPGQVAMEQTMACGVGPCYICVRAFFVDGKKVLRRVCKEGPVFNVQEALGW